METDLCLGWKIDTVVLLASDRYLIIIIVVINWDTVLLLKSTYLHILHSKDSRDTKNLNGISTAA